MMLAPETEQRVYAALKCIALSPDRRVMPRLLAGGGSGAITCRVVCEGRDFVLKLTEEEAGEYRFESAKRELRFYEDVAPELCVSVPRLIAFDVSRESVTLLFDCYEPAGRASEWTTSLFEAVARSLGHYHARNTDVDALRRRWPWIPTEGPAFNRESIDEALSQWTLISRVDRLHDVLNRGVIDFIGRLAGDLDRLDYLRSRLPPTLRHGDFHVDNLLMDESGNILWADWQEVQIGHPIEDLSHLVARARVDGAAVPDAAVAAAYHQELSITVDVTLDVVREALSASELMKIILHWPFYLGHASTERVKLLVDKMFELDGQLAAG